MSDETASEDEVLEHEEEEPGRRFSGKKLVLFVILPLLLVGGGGAGAFFAGLFDPLLGHGEEMAEAEEGHGEEADQAAVFYDMPDMLVNLSSNGRRSAFLKLKVSLELASAEDQARIEAVMPRIVDNFQVYLRELRVEDLQGATGMYRLREELLLRVNNAARPAQVNDVLFKEMLVQ
jgi:flagellar FliL protein